MTDYDVDDAANAAIEAIDALGLIKALVVVFDPADAAEEQVIYSNAAAAQLLPVLKAIRRRRDGGPHRHLPEVGWQAGVSIARNPRPWRGGHSAAVVG